jgi:hypothetical protein
MPRGQPEDTCGDHGGRRNDGSPCGRAAGWGTDFDSGKCRECRGTNPDGTVPDDHGAPENNGNAETHGMTSEAEKWFARHREDAAPAVKRIVDGWMQLAPFGWDVEGHVWLLVEAAINECQLRRGNQYLADEGLVVESFEGVADDGRDIITKKEHPALKPKSRLQRDTVRILEKVGILGDSDDTTVEVNVHEEILEGMKAAHQD